MRIRFIISVLFFSFLSSAHAEEAPLVPPYYAAELEHPTPSISERNRSQLQNMLTIYQNAAMHPWAPIPLTKKLKLHAKNTMVAIVRERLTLLGDLSPSINTDIFDGELLEAIKQFQSRHGLTADGVIGKQTRAALNISPQERLQQLQLNIERWTELSKRLGERYLLVNVPAYELYLVDDNKTILNMKVIIGKPTRQTPEVYSRITRLVFKPYWNVPPKIARKDIVKKAINDPNYLDENNIRVYDDENHSYEINNDNIDWQSAEDNGVPFHFRQDPGEKNSLGLVKFEFPNSFDVYLHDTPAKELFSQDVRDLSSGCVRLEKPFDLVAYLMKDDPSWNEDRQEELLARNKPTYVSVKKPLPVILTYLTAWIDDTGRLNFRDDIYERDKPSSVTNDPE